MWGAMQSIDPRTPESGEGLKPGYCRGIQNLPVGAEDRPMTGAVPALLKAVPVKMATQMGAGGRMLMDCSLGVSIGRYFLEAMTHDRALTGLQLVD